VNVQRREQEPEVGTEVNSQGGDGGVCEDSPEGPAHWREEEY